MPDPVLDGADRVATPPPESALPTELQGKTADEIYRHMQKQQQLMVENHNREVQRLAALNKETRPPVTSPKPITPAPKPSNVEFWNDPTRATETIAKDAVSDVRKDIDRILTPTQKTAIEMAEHLCSQRHMKEWPKFGDEVKRIVGYLAPEQQADVNIWDMAFYQVRGVRADELVNEAKSQVTAAERVQNAPPPPPPPKVLTAAEKEVADKLGLKHETFLKGKENMEEGTWPQTLNNVERK